MANIYNERFYDLELEKQCEKLGFKRKWFSDYSGYWMIKNITYKKVRYQIYVETDSKLLLLQVLPGDFASGKLTMNQTYDPVRKLKCNLKNIKKLIKEYK